MAIKAKGLQENYKKLVWAKKECTENLEDVVLNRDIGDKAVLTATKAQAKANSAVEHIASQIFQLYSSFLSEEARQPWSKILAKQIDSSLWKNLRGVVHNSPRSKKWDSFQECVTFHMLTVFRNDAAKAQRYYISNCLKKPNWFPSGSSCSACSSSMTTSTYCPACTRATKQPRP